ncbi:MAG: hypothetical protein ABW321_14955 [Polyangiales bacterium]
MGRDSRRTHGCDTPGRLFCPHAASNLIVRPEFARPHRWHTLSNVPSAATEGRSTMKSACAGDSCLCHVDSATAVHAGGHLYCSERCSEGKGCGHMGCSCGHHPVSIPVRRLRSVRASTATTLSE